MKDVEKPPERGISGWFIRKSVKRALNFLLGEKKKSGPSGTGSRAEIGETDAPARAGCAAGGRKRRIEGGSTNDSAKEGKRGEIERSDGGAYGGKVRGENGARADDACGEGERNCGIFRIKIQKRKKAIAL